MKEGISYSFLLNIVILFIFVCFAVIMGIMSYYRAFRAGAIIVDSIEKYEGYNCHSKIDISHRLESISYNVPFNVSCNNKKGTCEANIQDGYVVVANNLDIEAKVQSDGPKNTIKGDLMNSTYECSDNIVSGKTACRTKKHYQYNVYTYMYFDLPVISKIARIPFVSSTKILYEFRNWLSYKDTGISFDSFSEFRDFKYTSVNDSIYVTDENPYEDTLFLTRQLSNYKNDFIENYFELYQSIPVDSDTQPFIEYLSSLSYGKRNYVILKNKFKDRGIEKGLEGFYAGYSCNFKIEY